MAFLFPVVKLKTDICETILLIFCYCRFFITGKANIIDNILYINILRARILIGSKHVVFSPNFQPYIIQGAKKTLGGKKNKNYKVVFTNEKRKISYIIECS